MCDAGFGDSVAEIVSEGKEDENDDFGIDCVLGHGVLAHFVDEQAKSDDAIDGKEDYVVEVKGEEGDGHVGIDAQLLPEFGFFLFSGHLCGILHQI